MPATTAQPKRRWGPPAVIRAAPTSPGETPPPGNGTFIFVRSPSKAWSTDTLENYVAKLHSYVTNGADPALVAPHINSANAMLKERRARKDDGEAEIAGNETAPKR